MPLTLTGGFTVLDRARNKSCIVLWFGRAFGHHVVEQQMGANMHGASALISVFAVLLLVNVFAFVRRL